MRKAYRVWKPIVSLLAVLGAVLSPMSTSVAQPQPMPMQPAPAPEGASDRSLSPYFFVHGDDPSIDSLPLRSTSAAVTITGVIADVTVTQVYKNEGKRPLEAVYVFPASTRAAVYGMTMTIGERRIVAEIQKREQARETYEQARREGRSASLLEQQRPNVFQMNVANILPGDEIRTELRYTELLSPLEGTYEFVYPTVVGPRYSNLPAQAAPPTEQWVANSYLHQGTPPTYAFDLSVTLSAGLPIQEVLCPSHKVNVHYDDPSHARITLAKGEEAGGNRDFILNYRLAGKSIESGLLLWQGEKENFFLLTVQPPKHVAPAQVPPREVLFIVDVSGSMHGFPLEISKGLLKDLVGNLKESDLFNVLLFSGGSTLMAPQSLPATPENLRAAVELIDRQQGSGGTELLPALERALSLPRREGAARTVVIATDGYVHVEKEAFDLIRRNLGKANFFPFGIGSSVNRHLIEGMARAGSGEPFIVSSPQEAPAKAQAFRKLVAAPVLTGIRLDWGDFEAYDLVPAHVPDVFAERPVVVAGKWRGRPQGKITLTGIAGEGTIRKVVDVAGSQARPEHSALRTLWARSRAAALADDQSLEPDDTRVTEITELGLHYGLLTDYTSFVAVDTQVRNSSGETTTVRQPLPLPQGVSDYAVGRPMPAPGMAQVRSHQVLNLSLERTGSPEAADKSSRATGKLPPGGAAEIDPALSERAGRMALKELVVHGALSETAVRTEIERRLSELDTCRLQGRGSDHPLEIRLSWTIDPSGNVSGLKILGSGKLSGKAERCLERTVRAWRFERLPGAGKTLVRVVIGGS